MSKVLALAHAFPPESLGGAELYARDVAHALTDLGHDVAVLTPERDPGKPDYAVSWGRSGRLAHVRVNNLFRHAEDWDLVFARCAAMDARFASILDAVRPDAIHVHHLSGLSLGMPAAARERGIAVVYTLHDYWYLCPRGQMLRADLGRCEEIDVARCASCLAPSLDAETRRGVSLLDGLASARSTIGPGAAPPSLTRYAIAGVEKGAIFAHPPLAIGFAADVPAEAPELSFALGMDPEVCAPDRGEGVRFRVRVAGRVLFEELWDPKHRSEQRIWGERRVDLSAFAGCRIEIALETAPEHQGMNDHNAAAWGEPRLGNARAHRVACRARAFSEELSSARAAICPSRFLRDAHERAGVDPRVLRHADYGFDPRQFAGFARPPSPSFGVGFLGTLIPSKGAHVLLRAFERAAIPGARLRVWGRAVPWLGANGYEQELARHPAWRDAYQGEIAPDRIAEAFAQIDVLVVPSLWNENSPLVVHEAFLTGTPVIASRMGGIPELVRDGENGLLVPPGDERALGEALVRIAGDDGLRSRLSRPTPVRSLEEDARALAELFR